MTRTYAQLGIPYARDLRQHYTVGIYSRYFLQAHAKEMKRANAEARNWGWVLDETGIASKTTNGILQTQIRNGYIEHKWEVE